MKKIYRHLKFYIKSTFKNLKRHFGMTFSAITAVSITLILISIFSLLSANLANFTYSIENELTIRVSIDPIVKTKQKDTLKSDIEKIEGVKAVTYHSGTEELEAYKKEFPEEQELFSMYEGKSSPIRDTFVVEVKNATAIATVTKKVEAMKGIVEAGYGGSATTDMISGFASIREGSMIFICFLVLVASFLISNKIKMSIYTRREEIAVMRNVGASNWFIKAPMMLEGMLIGFFGALVPLIVTIAGYHFLYQALQEEMISKMFSLTPVYPLTIEISCLLMGLGVLVGFIGSFLSTTRNLRWKR